MWLDVKDGKKRCENELILKFSWLMLIKFIII